MQQFSFYRTPKIRFGAGESDQIAETVSFYGKNILLLTGGESLRSSGNLDKITKKLKSEAYTVYTVSVKTEPSPELVDSVVDDHIEKGITCVISVGGGSVIDAGKAVSAMLPLGESVYQYLEDVGTKRHPGIKVPFIAVPTTSGTGSEATKNAVISRIGGHGFKKSLRHDNFIPDIAVIDPLLSTSCPPETTASCGMDAFTQLLESFVSTNASPITDSLAADGLRMICRNLQSAYRSGRENVEARAAMAYGSLISGITLANAGLGVIHGLAAAIGGSFRIPHGVICGTLLAPATKQTIEKMRSNYAVHISRLEKYARAGALMTKQPFNGDIHYWCSFLIERLYEWTVQLKIPALNEFGITAGDIERIISAAGNKNNPVALDKNEIRKVLEERI